MKAVSAARVRWVVGQLTAGRGDLGTLAKKKVGIEGEDDGDRFLRRAD